MKMNALFLEWSGAITGVIGAGLLATNTSMSGFGFIAFLISNLFWIAFAITKRSYGLLSMQVLFTATSLLGVYRWLI
jgi:hypothetical protein